MNPIRSRTVRAVLAAGMLAPWALPTLRAAEGEPGRVSSGLLALYDFASSEGDVVRDRSGVGIPVDLEIADLEAVTRREGSLEILTPTVIKSPGRATKIGNTLRLSEEITVEVWIRPSESQSEESSTIVAVAPKSRQLNFRLSRQADRTVIRFRTTRTGTEALPPSTAPAAPKPGQLTHLVYTRDRAGRARLFLDGKQVFEDGVAGSMAGWERFPVVLANDLDGSSPWLGTYYLAAFYSRDLLAREVEQNFRAGPDFRAEPLLSESVDAEGELFEAKVAPLFAQKCLECHDAATKSGGLDLSHREAAFAEGPNGAVLVAGEAGASRLIEMIENDAMPLGRPPLLKSEKAMLREWVDSGASWTLDKLDPAVHHTSEKVSDVWVRRLTVPEYVATVKGVLGVDVAKEAAEILPPDERADGFRNTAYNLNVDLQHVGAYARLAEIVVGKLDVGALARRHSESRALTEENLDVLISGIGGKIFRGPPEEDEIAMYQKSAEAVISAEGGFEEVTAYMVETMLQSPRFLYRIENQRGDGTEWPAGEYELASRLSYILWGAPPDAQLMADAEAGKLHDPAVFDRQIQRMLGDPRAIERSLQFVSEWLDLERLDSLQPNKEKFPQWDPAVAADMREETLRFFRELVWEQERPLTDLLNAQFTYATPRLAKHYGLEPKDEGFARYDLSSVPSRGGLLTQASVLTIGGDEASMVTRGLFVLEELLLGKVGNPPPGLDTTPPPSMPGRSHRAISEERVKSAACGGCHSKFEPLAFGLERFDGVGGYREADEHGNSLRQDGQVLFPGEAEPIPYNTAAQMMDLLAASDRVQQSLTRKLAQFALGRPLVADDDPAIAQIQEQARRGGFTYASLVTALLRSDLVQLTRTEPLPDPNS